jgi:hypothetical protein
MEAVMGDTTRGVYDKFRVIRRDGRGRQGEKHYGCEYFVLDLDHDAHALPALLAYASSCEAEYPLLARDIREKARRRGLPVVESSARAKLEAVRARLADAAQFAVGTRELRSLTTEQADAIRDCLAVIDGSGT